MKVEHILTENTTHTGASLGSYGTHMPVSQFIDQFGANMQLHVNKKIGHKFDPLHQMPKNGLNQSKKSSANCLPDNYIPYFRCWMDICTMENGGFMLTENLEREKRRLPPASFGC